jgi:uncharacterized protein
MVKHTDIAEQCLAGNLLHLVLLPTETCNFRCVYCFERFGQARMAPGVVAGVKRYLAMRAPDIDRLTLSWFGGEPLLAVDLVYDLMAFAHELRARHPALTLRSNMTTNAYLLDRSRFDRLLALGVTFYHVTFDGPRAWHDRKRVLAGGGGTFDRVWHNLLALRDSPGRFEILVRLHADQDNYAALPEFIDDYAREFGGDRRFKLFVRELARFGGANDAALPVFACGAVPGKIDQLRRLIAERGLAELNREHMGSICYAARGNSYVIRADGRVNKCSLALEDPLNQVGRLDQEGSLNIDQARMLPWLRGALTADRAALGCPKKGLTAASAPPAGARPVVWRS